MPGRNTEIGGTLDELEFRQQELVELAALMDGTKPIMRLERSARVMTNITRQLAYHGLVVVEASFHITVKYRHVLGDTFVSVRPGAAKGDICGVYYIARKERIRDAITLAGVEAMDAASPEVGLRLGYPPCCVSAYSEIASGRDWVMVILKSTPRDRPGFVACNRLARLFGDWAVLPDYFPCSFACSASASWAADIMRSARAVGLGAYVDAAGEILRRPVRLDKKSILQFGVPPKIVAYSNALSETRVLWWL